MNKAVDTVKSCAKKSNMKEMSSVGFSVKK